MILQDNYTIPDMILFSLDTQLIVGFLIMVLLLIINAYLYKKMRIPILIIIVFLFSELIGAMLIADEQFFQINYLVYFVIFFMLYQAILFFLIIIKIYESNEND